MGFKLKLPLRFNAADYFVDRNIREGRGGKVAVICENRRFTYSQILEGVNRVGNGLQSLGVRMEERVALLLLDTEIYPMVFFGAIKIGAIPVNLSTLMQPQDYVYFLNDSRARILVVDQALLGQIDGIRDELMFLEHVIVVEPPDETGDIDFTPWFEAQSAHLDPAPTTPDDACFWLYSAGSTGLPKGTVHLQHDMVFSAQTYGKQVLQVKETDVCFSAAKLFFAFGLGNGLFFPFSVGATAVYHPGRPTPAALYEIINSQGVTIFFGAPTLFGLMLNKEGSLGKVKICVSAGEPLPQEIFNRWQERFEVLILNGIGSTEAAHIFISNTRNAMRPGSTGRIVPGYEARIVDEHFIDLPDKEIGTLLIKGDSCASSYWNKHEKTKNTMLGSWLNTDDKFYKDDDGFFFYVDRGNEMLKVGGIWTSPIEIEACLIEHPAVLDCTVIGAPDQDQLIKPKAFVVLRKGQKAGPELEKQLKEHVKSKLAHYKYPRWIAFVEELPKTAASRTKRFRLKGYRAAEYF
jgi:benzoate-CoA ligase